MIKTWQHKGLKKFYDTGNTSEIISEHASRIMIILQLLDNVASPNQLNLPGFGFHKLRGKFKNFYAVTVRANWRIIFQFNGKDVILVNYLDYH